jgi:hypothetical protein
MKNQIGILWICVLLLVTGCTSRTGTPSLQPIPVTPTRISITPQVANNPAYPLPNLSPYPIPATINTPYPNPIRVGPAPTITSIPTINPSPIVTAEPTLPPFGGATQSVQPFYPKCIPEGLNLQCSDDVLGIRFKYPSHWGGFLSSELISGTCGGYFYHYLFSGSDEVSAGGSSADYCKPIGGNLITMFRGFKPGQGCNLFPEAQDCRQINDNVFIATLFPDFKSLCDPGPSSISTPLMVVGINIPGNHIVSGVLFSVKFLSVKGTDKLLEPFGAITIYNDKCNDPKTEIQYNQLVEEISQKVRQGTFDEETSYRVKGIIDFANSITFSP